MKAIRITRTGGPEVLEYVELPTPEPGDDEVLIKAHAIGVCMPETAVRKGTYKWMPKLPAIPGIEMSGTVVKAGPGVRSLKVGQPVFVSAREFEERAGCYAEYVKAPEHKIEINSLFFGHAADDRSVTMKLDGKEVIVREGDVAEDLQVETILPDGVVFKRGKRRFAVYKQ